MKKHRRGKEDANRTRRRRRRAATETCSIATETTAPRHLDTPRPRKPPPPCLSPCATSLVEGNGPAGVCMTLSSAMRHWEDAAQLSGWPTFMNKGGQGSRTKQPAKQPRRSSAVLFIYMPSICRYQSILEGLDIFQKPGSTFENVIPLKKRKKHMYLLRKRNEKAVL